MNLGEVIQQFREKADDLAIPYLWKDEEVKSFINQAQQEAAIRSKALRYRVKLLTVANISEYPYTAFVKDNGDAINGIVTDLYDFAIGGYPLNNTTCKGMSRTGKPREYSFDIPDYIKFYPTPIDIQTVNAIAVVIPNNMANSTDNLSMPIEMQPNIVYWALKLAYEKQDIDASDMRRSQNYDAIFTEYFGKRHNARARIMQRRHIWN